MLQSVMHAAPSGPSGVGQVRDWAGKARNWSGQAHNGWFPLVAVIILGHGAATGALLAKTSGAAPLLNLAHVLALAVFELFARIRVTISERTLLIRYGYIGWLCQRVALERVASARAVELSPLAHGGWGYRGSLRLFGRASCVVRGGPALELTLERGRRFSVTLDDADSAARWVNAALARRAARDERDAAR
jgi:hypothetical protein